VHPEVSGGSERSGERLVVARADASAHTKLRHGRSLAGLAREKSSTVWSVSVWSVSVWSVRV
jgi:hypothetical protein